MALPKSVTIREVGPREGMQIEKNHVATADKIRLVDLLSACNFSDIEVTSFVSPKAVPQMADASEVAAGFTPNPATRYTCVYLNTKGAERALATGKLDVEGILTVTASETFSKRNTNRDIEQTFTETRERIEGLSSLGVKIDQVSILAAFGCNYEGDIDPRHVISLTARLMDMAREHGLGIGTIQLADTMGWANPNSIRRLVGDVKNRWPDPVINLHLHDTRGLGLMNVMAAMEIGVDDFDSSVGGLGGCPFAGFSGAAGNIATEDLVHLCGELGVETGIDLDRLIDAAREAELIVGHPLPGKVMHGGALAAYRRRVPA